MHIILIAGLPGSGKTTYAKKLAEVTGAILIDDPVSLNSLPNSEVSDLIIADLYFCFESCRKNAEKFLGQKYKNAIIKWIFFENNPQQCKENSKNRVLKRVSSLIESTSKQYNIPEDAVFIPVWRSSNDN